MNSQDRAQVLRWCGTEVRSECGSVSPAARTEDAALRRDVAYALMFGQRADVPATPQESDLRDRIGQTLRRMRASLAAAERFERTEPAGRTQSFRLPRRELSEVESLEADGLVYAARSRAAEPVTRFQRTGEGEPLPFTAAAERREQDRREHTARRARAAREVGVSERLAASSRRVWPA